MSTGTEWENLHEIDIFHEVKFLREEFSKKKYIFLIWFFGGILPAIVFFTTSMAEGTLTLEGNGLGLLKDSIFLSYFLYIPTIVSMAIYYFPNFSGELGKFKNVVINEQDVVPDGKKILTEEEFNGILKLTEKKLLGKGKLVYLKALFYICGIAWAALTTRSHWFTIEAYGRDIWSSQFHQLSFFIRALFELAVFGFVFPYILYKYAIILHSIRDICRKLTHDEVLKLRPLNPDKAGGLGFLGKYNFYMSLFIMPLLIPIVFYIIVHEMNIVITLALIVYVPAMMLAFFYPLSGAHEVMKKFKERELEKLSREFNNMYDHLISNIMPKKVADLPAVYEVLEKIEALYNKAVKMPVWPFDTKTLAKFFSIIGATLSAIWLEWIIKFLVGK